MSRVGEGGLEPPRPFGHRNLNPARLPIPPLARVEGSGQRAVLAGYRAGRVAGPGYAYSAPPMGLKGFERRLERMVEGVFARAFRSGLRPVELGRRLVREMDDNRSVDVRGRTVVPNHFTVAAVARRPRPSSPTSHETLGRELADAAREHARDEGYTFLGPGRGRARSRTARMRTGAFQIDARDEGGRRAARAPGRSCCPTGDRVALGEHVRHHRPPARVQHRARRPQREPAPRRDPAARAAGSSSSTSAPPTAPGSTASGSSEQRAARRRRDRRSATPASRFEETLGRQPPAVSEQLLTILKLCLLALLYLFFFRVLRAVWAEVSTAQRPPRRSTPGGRGHRRSATTATKRPGGAAQAGAQPTELIVVEPPDQAGPPLPAGRRAHRRPGRGLPDHRRRHLRLPAPRPRLPSATASCFVEDLGSTNGTYLNRAQGAGPDGDAPGRPAPGGQHRAGGR